jgi:hypothetical protein
MDELKPLPSNELHEDLETCPSDQVSCNFISILLPLQPCKYALLASWFITCCCYISRKKPKKLPLNLQIPNRVCVSRTLLFLNSEKYKKHF